MGDMFEAFPIWGDDILYRRAGFLQIKVESLQRKGLFNDPWRGKSYFEQYETSSGTDSL